MKPQRPHTVKALAVIAGLMILAGVGTANAGNVRWQISIGGYSHVPVCPPPPVVVERTVVVVPQHHYYERVHYVRRYEPVHRPSYRHGRTTGHRYDRGPRAIIHQINGGQRLYQPRVRGHVAFVQQYRGRHGWVTVDEHPSIW